MWSDGSDFTYDNWYEHPYQNDDEDDEDDHMDDKKSPDDNNHHDAKKENCLRINYECKKHTLSFFYIILSTVVLNQLRFERWNTV